MAGDWIKLEHATLDKPEVSRFADLLGVSHGDGVELLLRFWIWMDNNASGICPGNVRHMSAKCLDRTMHCPGFCGALQAVGWLEIDAEGVSITVPNFATHNGSTAKTRASDAKRKSEKRLENVREMSEKNRTREEKRRVTTKGRLTAPTEEHEKLAAELGVNCADQFLQYQDYFAANGKEHADQAAGFRNWLRKAATYKRPPVRPAHGRDDARRATIEGLTGRAGGGGEAAPLRVVNEND